MKNCSTVIAAIILFVLVAWTAVGRGDIHGFMGFSAVNTTAKSVGLKKSKTILVLTNGKRNEATSCFFPIKQRVGAFQAVFTYQAKVPPGGGGDGVALVLQRDPRGVRALGGDGGDLGLGGQNNSINGSSALELDVLANGISLLGMNGQTGVYTSVSPINLASGDPIRVTAVFNGLILRVTLEDLKTHAIYRISSPFAPENRRAYVGFTGASGADTAVQKISQFKFISHQSRLVSTLSLPQLRHMLGLPEILPGKDGRTPLVAYVNPFIGTANTGAEFPGPVMPFGMVQLSPDTRPRSMGYYYRDSRILGFSMLHMSGVGMNDEGDVFFTATTGSVNMQHYASSFSHQHESAEVGYYRVRLLKPDVNVELTSARRAGMVRFTFPSGKRANVLIPISHTMTRTRAAHVRIVSRREIEGFVTSRCMAQGSPYYTVYFAMRFSAPFWRYGTWKANKGIKSGNRQVTQSEVKRPHVGAYVSWSPRGPRSITVKIGLSYVSIGGARKNLAEELGGKTFGQIRRAAVRAWDRILHRISIQGGTAEQKMMFYTALYHCLLMPSIFSDVDGRYIGFDDRIHHLRPRQIQYTDYSGWDIYRDEAPLLALVAPGRMQQMCQSLVRDARQGGWMPRWPEANKYTNIMIGSPLTSVVCTAWEYGLHGFNMKEAYRAMFEDATEPAPPNKPYRGETGIDYMNKIHYIPTNRGIGGSVSQTEEDCCAYSALARVAKNMGKTADAQLLRRRAMYWKNLFDPATKFMRPRLENGRWALPFNPAARPFTPAAHAYVEGSGCEYQWYVPQDIDGLIQLMGQRRFTQRLDRFFRYITLEWSGRYYNAYDEPDIEAPFLYDYCRQPWKTQELVRRLIRQDYNITPTGLAGNDDCGAMSSWLIFSMMGIYPVEPGYPAFELCSPVFRHVVIYLRSPYRGGEFTISTPKASVRNQYIQSVSFNGKPYWRCWIKQASIVRGGSMVVTLGAKPDWHWGNAPDDRPPSMSSRPSIPATLGLLSHLGRNPTVRTAGVGTAGSGRHGFSHFGVVNSTSKSVGFNDARTVFTITDGKHDEATSVFSARPWRTSAFHAKFTYQARTRGGDGGNGFAFVLECDPRGGRALGGDGAELGYGGISDSAAVEFNILGNGSGFYAGPACGHIGAFIPTGTVHLGSGHRIRVRLNFNGLILRVKLKDRQTGNTWQTSLPFWTPASKTWVGFTGGSGAAVAVQTISHFSFIPELSKQEMLGATYGSPTEKDGMSVFLRHPTALDPTYGLTQFKKLKTDPWLAHLYLRPWCVSVVHRSRAFAGVPTLLQNGHTELVVHPRLNWVPGNLVYRDDFARGSVSHPQDINGSMPTPIDTGQAVWIAKPGQFFVNGSEVAVARTVNSSAFLPLSILPDRIYTLSATLIPQASAVGPWLALGFGGKTVANPNNPASMAWVLYKLVKQHVSVQTFWGGGTRHGRTTRAKSDNLVAQRFQISINSGTGQVSFRDGRGLSNRFCAAGSLTPADLRKISAVFIGDNTDHGMVRNFQLTIRNALHVRSIVGAGQGGWPASSAGSPELLLDFGREVAGQLQFSGNHGTLLVHMGESPGEALYPEMEAGDGPWSDIQTLCLSKKAITSTVPRGFGFRYAAIRFLGTAPNHVNCLKLDFQYSPVIYRGTFTCSDPLLTRIWYTGAYTVHLCMQDDIYDAPKRDRGMWMGDLQIEGGVIEDVFPDKFLLERTMSALRHDAQGNHPPAALPENYVNGIVGYSNAWICGLYDLYMHTGDIQYIRRQRRMLISMLRYMKRGFNRHDIFVNKWNHWCFTDWAPHLNSGDTPQERVAVDLYTCLAVRRAVVLLKVLEDKAEAEKYWHWYTQLVATARQNLASPRTHTYTALRQVNAMAIYSGVADKIQRQAIIQTILGPSCPAWQQVATPYYNYFVVQALGDLGRTNQALRFIRSYWGGMIHEGATTFWEAYDPRWPKKHFHRYLQADNRPGYFVSLCHGWSSGVTSFLTEYVLGVRPTGGGFTTASIVPHLGILKWVRGRVPAPRGNIVLSVMRHGTSESLHITLPPGVKAMAGVVGRSVTVDGHAVIPVRRSAKRCYIQLNQAGEFSIVGHN
jgi:predicted alpha-1,2-mannosidase